MGRHRRLRIGWTAAIAGVMACVLPMGVMAFGHSTPSAAHPSTGVGSCTLKGWNASTDPADAKDLPTGQRHQSYRPDDYDCTGATFAQPGVEFSQFPQPHNFNVNNEPMVRKAPVCEGTSCNQLIKMTLHPEAATNPLSPFFPPFTHFVVIYRENHTFDDYLGDCATTVQAGCNGQVQSTNNIASVPQLHTLAKTYGLDDAYSTGTQPPSGPNHWWMFSGQSSSSSQQQAYPSSGTQFDRFLGGTTGPAGEGTNPCTAQTGSGTGTSPYTFVMNGDFYWMVSSGSGWWKNPGDNTVEVLPVNRPGTTTPEELHQNEFTCSNQNISDTTITNDYESYVNANGLPAYNYIELFNDHPGTFQDIPTNDSDTSNIVNFLMGNATYKDNTVIIVTEDDTQNGSNGPDHVSNTFRVPLVVIGSPANVKQHYLSHVAYTTSNVIAAMERTMQNVHSGIIDPNDNIGLSTFPMTTADQSALGDPLEDFWVQGSTPLSAQASGTPSTGNAPLTASFTGSATGGTAPYSFSWNFGDGSAASTAQNPSHTYSAAGTYNAVLTVTDASSPAKTATAGVTITVSAVGNPLAATAAANPTSGQVPLTVAFTGTATGGTPGYSFSWNFGDGSPASTAQNPSHTYSTAGTYDAVLTVTDASSPPKTATSKITITASPIAATPPGAPTGLAASPGNAQVSLSWSAPSSNGGEIISSYKVYRGTASGSETLLTAGGCSGLGAVLSCTDTGLTNGQAYFYKVSAVNALGEGPQSTEASATPTSPPANLVTDGGFESATSSGNSAPGWSATASPSANVIKVGGPYAHTGGNYAEMGGVNNSSDTLTQSISIPSSASTALMTFWCNVDTQESSNTTAYDYLKVEVHDANGNLLATPLSLDNRNKNNDNNTNGTYFQPAAVDLSAYKGQTIQLVFRATTDYIYPTTFRVDDVSVSTSSSGSQQLLGNPGFENGTTSAPWAATSGVINNSSTEPPRTGSWDAWMDGYGTTHTDTLSQQVAIPSTISQATLSFWLHIDTAETSSTTAYDTLKVQVRDPSGNVLTTLATYSNLDHNTGYTQKSFDLSAYKGQTVQVYFLGQEDYTLQTSFVIDDTALNVS